MTHDLQFGDFGQADRRLAAELVGKIGRSGSFGRNLRSRGAAGLRQFEDQHEFGKRDLTKVSYDAIT